MANKATDETKRPSSQIGVLTLIDVSIEFDPELEVNGEIEASFKVEITRPDFVEIEDEAIKDAVAFQAAMQIGKGRKGAEQYTTFVTATYLCGMRCEGASEAEVVEIAKHVAQTTIWSNFTSLAAVLTQQMHAEFPVLPPRPSAVAVATLEDGEVSGN